MPYIILSIIIAVIISFFGTPKGKGIYGEFKIKCKIGKTKPNVQYVFNNYKVIVDGKSSQIDHIVVNKNGVFVIETKNYAGRIYGNDNQLEWTQVLVYGKVKNKFYNPVKQNNTHIYQLSTFLPKNTNMKSIIVFVNNNIKFVQSNNVFATHQLKMALRTNYGKVYSQEEMLEIVRCLEANRNNTLSNRKHVKNINEMQREISNNICPRCHSELVLRKGQYGNFYGCSNYPKCKFKKKA